MIKVVITDLSGAVHELAAKPGDSIMQLARAAQLPVAGDCNGSLACATCHMIVDPEWAGKLAPVSEDEEAMLDAVFNLSPTSRLSCQIRMTPALDGIRLALPA
jgi:2Fe-2S ferredoxin